MPVNSGDGKECKVEHEFIMNTKSFFNYCAKRLTYYELSDMFLPLTDA